MKKIYLSLIAAILAVNFSYAQWTNQSGTGNYFLNSGNVGIGTTTPNSLLSITPVAASLSNTSNIFLAGATSTLADVANSYLYPFEFQHSNSQNTDRLQFTPYRRVAGPYWMGTAYRIQFAVDNSFTDGSKAYLEIGASDPSVSGSGFIALGTNGTDRLAINGAGNVGIGTINPSSIYGYTTLSINNTAGGGLLDLQAAGISKGYIYGNSYGLNIDANGGTNPILFHANGGEIMRITSAGNVGIGIVDPQAGLHLSTNGTSSNATAQFTGDMIIQGNPGNRTSTTGSSLEFVIPAFTDGSNPWGQARIIAVAGSTVSGTAVGKLILGTRRWFDKGTGTGTTWNYGDDIVIDGAGNVGIGTTNPAYKFQVNTGTDQNLQIRSYTFGSSGIFLNAANDANNASIPMEFGASNFSFNIGNVGIGTTAPAAKLDIGSNTSTGASDILERYTWLSDLNNWGLRLEQQFNASFGRIQYNWIMRGGSTTDIPMMSFVNGSVAIGTTDPKGYKLAVAGSAVVESMTVKLQTDWPDYVFKPNYTLPSLTEVKSYIDKNQHLPEMPSEQEISEKGLNLGEMNKLLVKKVEELTLYLIEKDRQLGDQQNQLKAQQVQLDASKRSSEVQSAHIQRIEDELNVVLNKIKTAQ